MGLYAEEIEGNTDVLNEDFTFRAGNGAHYSRQKLVEAIPGKTVVWRVTEAEFPALEGKDEWVGTEIRFDISRVQNKTQVTFTHSGLVPEMECFQVCSKAWERYLQERLFQALVAG